MDKKNGVKVTFIETQFVTSDAASFKSVVQLLTGKSAGADGRSAAGSRSCMASSSAGSVSTAAGRPAQPCLEDLHEICDFSELFYAVASERCCGGGSYNGFPY